jgi:uracil-DNA glycosylase
MSWMNRRRNLLRKELAGLEAEIALCERCYGDSPRLSVRFDRPGLLPRTLILGERPPRRALETEARLSLQGASTGARALSELLAEAGISEDDVLLGSACLCRPQSHALERVVPSSVCIEECAAHVRELVRLTGPRLVLVLGADALRSLQSAFPESAAVAGLRFPVDIGRTVDAGGVRLRVLHGIGGRPGDRETRDRRSAEWRDVGALWSWIVNGEHGPPPGVSCEGARLPVTVAAST